MFYKNIVINDVEYPIAVNISGNGAPTAATEGAVAMFYMDVDSERIYVCTKADVENGEYTWKEFVGGGGGAGKSVVSSEINENGELEFTYSDGDVVNVGKVVGDKGDPGERGERGEQGPQGEKGADGKDGYTPVKDVDYFDGKDGKDGVDGKDGADGYTPVKGTDYWTEAEKSEMVSDVIAALPVYNGEVATV